MDYRASKIINRAHKEKTRLLKPRELMVILLKIKGIPIIGLPLKLSIQVSNHQSSKDSPLEH